MKILLKLSAILLLMCPCAFAEVTPFSIAAVADPQYADADPRGNREPREGVARLQHAVTNWNQRTLDWGVVLGDLIDWDDIDYGQFPQSTETVKPQGWANTRAILSAWNQLDIPKYTVLGNHDYYVPYADADRLKKPASVYRAFGFDDRAHYDFHHKGFRFVVLDGDFHYLNFDPSLPEYRAAREYYDGFTGPQKTWWNAAISVEQRIWLMETLDRSLAVDEPVVVMCHYPIHQPFGGHTLMNSAEMLDLLNGYPNVVLWLNGHNHGGDYAVEGRRHHLNLKGMQNEAENWYQIDFTSDRIKAYQAEDTTTPKHDLDISRPDPTVAAPAHVVISNAVDAALLRWDAEPDGVTAVVIERRHIPSAEAWQTVATIDAPSAGKQVDSPDKPIEEYAYRIRFEDGAEGSRHSPALTPDKLESGSERTGDGPFKIAFGSCASRGRHHLPIYDDIVKHQPDLFIFLGDNIYGDTKDMHMLRQKYDDLASDPSFQNLKKQTDMLAVWDDHDYGQNDAGKHYPHKEASKEIFLEFFEEPKDSERYQHEGIYHSVYRNVGDKTLQIILLDGRTFRDDLLRTKKGKRRPKGYFYNLDYAPHTNQTATLLGEQQWVWLEEELKKSADVRILASGSQFGIEYNGYEAWANFPHEQERLVQLIKETQAEHLVVLSGDVHYAEISKFEHGDCYPLYDITASGLSQTWRFATPNRNRIEGPIMENHFGLLTLHVSDPSPSMTVEIWDYRGNQRVEYEIPFHEISFSKA